MIATFEPTSVRPEPETISWGLDLCWPRENAGDLPGAFAGVHLGGGRAVITGGQVEFEDLDVRELAAALRGMHPIDCMRALLRDTGSLEWRCLAHEHRLSTRGLEDLAARWPHYGAVTEWALMEAARTGSMRESTREWRLLSDRTRRTLEKLARLFVVESGPEEAPLLAGRIAAAIPGALERRLATRRPGEPVVLEVCLPFLSRREWAAREQVMENMLVDTGADGRLWVRRAEEDPRAARNRFHCFAAGAGPWMPAIRHPRPAGFSLTFEDRREFKPGHLPEEYREVLARYGLPQTLPEFPGEEPVSATFHLRLPGEGVLRWTMLPAEREEPYFESFRPVAQAVQEVSRCWAPVSWFWNFTEQVEVYVPQARLAFASTPLSSLQSVETLAYEVLDDNSRRRALEGARLAIPPRLERARRLLLDAGLPMRANNYLPRAASKIYRTQLRQRRTYDTYLLADAQTVDQLALLATAGRNLRQAALREPARAARRLFEFMTDFHISMGRRTRRMFPNGDLAEYPSLVLLEATHALAPEFKREATLILRQGAREIVLRN